MLRIAKATKDTVGVWFDFQIRGETISLKIRPLSAEVIAEIRKRHRSHEMVKDPQSRQLQKTEVFDEDKITADLIDYLLEDFGGIGDETGTALSPTKENKKSVMNIPSLVGEVSITDFVFEKAKELAAYASAEDVEQEKK
ncbi:hypothetical protein [Candidatus Magnetominusculus xianensis]|uniref:Uncharacterized protein n=1 Tax=Candidatus Magnetominusculus xianensis TaxID=1748249 RepID=A0ABR5SCF9_9BACT|nr:hypothetical protein [Candidatus Magnetominusculus xianensis]KWT81142.1 hypothetical protein ASN18_2648 [Candidatus Magnetominusculus xianensis]MBF0402972.1 hypothetical protein [Nitrospirota bacterium]